jgi:hypothetical protein
VIGLSVAFYYSKENIKWTFNIQISIKYFYEVHVVLFNIMDVYMEHALYILRKQKFNTLVVNIIMFVAYRVTVLFEVRAVMAFQNFLNLYFVVHDYTHWPWQSRAIMLANILCQAIVFQNTIVWQRIFANIMTNVWDHKENRSWENSWKPLQIIL